MSKYHSYLNNAAKIIRDYRGEIPLAAFLKDYFGKHKKFGSKDRKEVSALAHQFFRLGHLGGDLSIEEKILSADFICRGASSQVIENLKPQWCQGHADSPIERMKLTGIEWIAGKHTPWLRLLSSEINPEQYAISHLTQPDLFIRVRPGKKQKVIRALDQGNLHWNESEPDCIRLPNTTRLEEIISINRDAVVQDLNSSKCGMVIKKIIPGMKGWVWDTCSASGGKSILIHDLFGKDIKLMVSDIRPAILQNLKKRLFEAGITPFHMFAADLSKPLLIEGLPEADVVLIDAPCTGSGTWARTPEYHYFFNEENVYQFAEKQFSICTHAIKKLKPGGYIIYITCSVFAAENEIVLEKLIAQQEVSLVHKEYLIGTSIKADSMFIAILKGN